MTYCFEDKLRENRSHDLTAYLSPFVNKKKFEDKYM